MQKAQETQESVSDKIINGFNHLIDRFPDSPEFLGKEIYFPITKRAFFRSKKRPDLKGLRDEIQRIAKKGGVSKSREIISKKMKQFPHWGDLYALKAVQLYLDLLQSGISTNKMDALYDPLKLITKGLYNEGVSIFNANWFMTIYLKYLELMKERLSKEYDHGLHHANAEVRKSAERLYMKILKISRMMQVKNQLVSLKSLNKKLTGNAILTEVISLHELKMSCQAVAAKNPNKTLYTGKTANSVLYVTLVLNSLFARIPILKDMVNHTLKAIPDLNRDLILQKQMIINNGYVNDYLLAMASGNQEHAKIVSDNLYRQCRKNIEYYLENAILTQPHEVDLFNRAAWIAKESRVINSDEVNKKRLKQSYEYMNTLIGDRCQHKGALDKASSYQNEIRLILVDQGWE